MNDGVVKFEVNMVGSATETLAEMARVGSSHYDILLLDMLLPDQNAYELLPQLRKIAGDNVAMVIASAHTQVLF